MKIRIDGIATVWLEKRGLPVKRKSSAEEYKAKVEAYLIANPADWPYYNREGRLDPFGGEKVYEQSHQENPSSLPQPEPEIRQVPQAVESKEKIYYVIVRQSPLGVREFMKTYAYQDQAENEKWSDNPVWADRFLNPIGAGEVAKRILGHEKFKIEPL